MITTNPLNLIREKLRPKPEVDIAQHYLMWHTFYAGMAKHASIVGKTQVARSFARDARIALYYHRLLTEVKNDSKKQVSHALCMADV
jgi:hypothetical protein